MEGRENEAMTASPTLINVMEVEESSGGPQQQVMSMGMPFGMGMFEKKRRGRPKKYAPDGAVALSLSAPPSFPSSSLFASKRGRGRPPGSGKRQLLSALGEWFAGSAGGNFTPHVVTIAAGEDVATKILSFSQKGPRAICILSANGAISNVTLRQPGSSGGMLTYEGRFEILSLSGSFTVTNDAGVRSRTGGISVSLAGPDGRVVGGGVAGLLLAASPIQVVVGSFTPNRMKDYKRKLNSDSGILSPVPTAPGVLMSARPISQANPNDDTCATPTSILPQRSHGDTENTLSNQDPSCTSFHTVGWLGTQSTCDQKPSPDINICLPME